MSTIAPRERRRVIEGTYNLRDVGGYPAEGGEIRWHKLFRSDGLHRLTDDSQGLFSELGVSLIVDLRDADELEAAPDRIEGLGIEVVHLPLFEGITPELKVVASASLASVYQVIIEHQAQNLIRAIRAVAQSGDRPVLVHCTAGKDRTGMVIAIALLAVGVPSEFVVADYAATEQHLSGEWAEEMLERVRSSGAEITPELQEIMTASPPAAMEHIIELIEAEHGSVRGYLLAHGVTEGELDELRRILVTSEGALETTEKEGA